MTREAREEGREERKEEKLSSFSCSKRRVLSSLSRQSMSFSSSSSSQESEYDDTPFSYTELINLVPLHPDLANEPFSFADDGIRPDIRCRGDKFFRFSITKYEVSFRAGDMVASGVNLYRSEFSSDAKIRESTTTSLIDIYHSYGLDMVYSLLEHIYYVCDGYSIHLYVAGSVAMLDPDYGLRLIVRPEADTELMYAATRALISHLLLKLLYIESRQPKLAEPLTTVSVTLPDEILARIVGGRVSKSIREKYLAQIRARPLPLGAVADVRLRPCTCNVRRHYALDYTSAESKSKRWCLSTSKTGLCKLENIDTSFSHRVGRASVFSPEDYLLACKLRGKNGVDMVRQLLWNESMCIGEKLAWIVQLAFEVDYEVEVMKMEGREIDALFGELRSRFWNKIED